MQLESPPTTTPYAKAEGDRRGTLIVYTGDEMMLVKHAFRAGIPVQRGIED